MWRPYVFSKLARRPGGKLDEFHMLTESSPSDLTTVQRITNRHILGDESSVAFIHHGQDGITVGIDGVVSDSLGAENEFAHEWREFRSGPQKGRRITFVHGYVGPQESEIPSLNRLLERHKQDFGEVLERANREEAVAGKPIRIAPVEFASGQKPGATQWDEVAREFESGKRTGQTAVFTKSGKHLGWLSPEVGALTGGAMAAEKKKLQIEVPKKLTFLPLAAITLGALTAGWLAWGFVRTMTKQEQKTTSNHGQLRH